VYLRWVPCSFLPRLYRTTISLLLVVCACSLFEVFPQAPLVFPFNKTNSGPRARPGRVPATTNLIRCQRYTVL